MLGGATSSNAGGRTCGAKEQIRVSHKHLNPCKISLAPKGMFKGRKCRPVKEVLCWLSENMPFIFSHIVFPKYMTAYPQISWKRNSSKRRTVHVHRRFPYLAQNQTSWGWRESTAGKVFACMRLTGVQVQAPYMVSLSHTKDGP